MDDLDPIWIDLPHVRIRRSLDLNEGRLNAFVVQLEYDVAGSGTDDPDWRVVARFDHEATSAGGHDVTEEGLHLDIYRNEERIHRLWGFPRLPAGQAMRFAEETLLVRSERLIARFERWHDLDRGP